MNDYLIIGINLGDYGSTGNIMINSLHYAHNNGPFDVLALIPYKTKQSNPIETISFEVKIQIFKRIIYKFLRLLKFPIINDGNYYTEYTNNLINIIKKKASNYKVTLIHMHNVHTSNLNVNKLYKWLRLNKQYKVLYTLHDCWSFTGGCCNYDFIKCYGWKNNCHKCPQGILYSKHQLKKRTNLLNKINNLTLIPCSKWLENEIKESKLKTIKTIVNYGETSMNPYDKKTDLKERLGLQNKTILISVSSYWTESKGVKYLFQLADILPSNYVLLMIGGGIKDGHKNIVHIESIYDNSKLAEYYSISDVFVSTTQSDNLPLVLMEAQICGVPIVGFGHGGTPEEITRKTGIMVGVDNDVEKLLDAIKYVVDKKPFSKDDIKKHGSLFAKYESAKRQLLIYMDLIK